MSRRALPIVVAAVGLVLIPSTASAAPERTPVETRVDASYSAWAQGSLTDGRQVFASLGESRSAGDGRRASVSLTLSPGATCWPTTLCSEGTGSAFLTLDADDVDFDRNLARATVTNLTVVLERYEYADGEMIPTRTEETVEVTLVFTGTGDVARDTYRGEQCGDGSSECQSTRVDFTRAAEVEITIDTIGGSGAGQLARSRSVDAAIRPSAEEGSG